MALSLIAATALASAMSASAAHHSGTKGLDLQKACKAIESRAKSLQQEVVSCGQGFCDDDKADKCKDGMVSLKLIAKLPSGKDGKMMEKCFQQCVHADGHEMMHVMDDNKSMEHEHPEHESDKDHMHMDNKDQMHMDDKDMHMDDKDHMHMDDKDHMHMDDKDHMHGDQDHMHGDHMTATDKDAVSVDKTETTEQAPMMKEGTNMENKEISGEKMEEKPMQMGGMDDADAPAMAACDNILDALAANDDGAVLVQIASKALLPETLEFLSDPMANVTVLVPPAEDLLQLLGGWQNDLISDDDLRTILKLHVLLEPLEAAELIALEGDMVETAAGEDEMLMVGLEGDSVAFMANNTQLVREADIEGCTDSQVIHLLDGVLIPEGMDFDLATFPAGSLEDVEELPPAGGQVDRGVNAESEDSGAASVAGLFATVAVAAVAVLAL